jgi:hypothetical protein
MSVSTIIKNIILLILIILIGHFMIQNILTDKNPIKSKSSIATANVDAITTGKNNDDVSTKITQAVVSTEKTVGLPSSTHVEKVGGGLDKAKLELLKFVDDEEDTIDTFFAATPTLKMQVVPNDNCKLKTQDGMLPLSTTCDPLINDLNKSETTNASVAYDKKGLMILKEYDNESSMNGGSLFGGLNAFDAFTDNFQTLLTEP